MALVNALFAFSALLTAVGALTGALILAYASIERWSVAHRSRLVVREAQRELLRHRREETE